MPPLQGGQSTEAPTEARTRAPKSVDPRDSNPVSRAPISRPPAYRFQGKLLIGFGRPSFYVELLDRRISNGIIRACHYSHTVVNNSYIHLGVFRRGELVGAVQFGYMLNPRRMERVVLHTAVKEYLELNRMWLSDAAPRNSESQALSYAVKYIRRAHPQVKWIQSFADERCGGWGVVYQACSFQYLGCHLAKFYRLDGQWYHTINMTAAKRGGQRGVYLRANRDRAEIHHFRQFRYIRFLKPRFRQFLNFDIQPYPKNPRGLSLGRPAPSGASQVQPLEAAPSSVSDHGAA